MGKGDGYWKGTMYGGRQVSAEQGSGESPEQGKPASQPGGGLWRELAYFQMACGFAAMASTAAFWVAGGYTAAAAGTLVLAFAVAGAIYLANYLILGPGSRNKDAR